VGVGAGIGVGMGRGIGVGVGVGDWPVTAPELQMTARTPAAIVVTRDIDASLMRGLSGR
jgi:hypothetical protein